MKRLSLLLVFGVIVTNLFLSAAEPASAQKIISRRAVPQQTVTAGVGSSRESIQGAPVDPVEPLFNELHPVTLPRTFAPQRADAGLVINATFDSSITSSPNAAAIEAMIDQAIAIYQSQYNDPVTISILFRYSTLQPNGNPMGAGSLAQSNWIFYNIAWNNFMTALTADAKTGYDATAGATLPVTALSTNISLTSANGRALGFNTPGGITATGTCCTGTFDGIVSLNSGQPFLLTRPTSAGNYDALRSTEHEMDEVLGLGSLLNLGPNLRPQDLFNWSSAGTRNLTSSGTRYFSINAGTTNLAGFNQISGGDFGDWISPACPQANPFVQNAFSCPGQFSDVTTASPEGINLDVIGYDLAGVAVGGTVTTLDGHGLRNATVSITNNRTGANQTALTGSFGSYQFANIVVGDSYTINVTSKHYRFLSQAVPANGNLATVNFTGDE